RVNQTTGDIEQPSFVANLHDIGYAMSFDLNGNLWLSDTSRILEYDPTGTLLKTISNPASNIIFSAVFNPPYNAVYAGDVETGNIFSYDLSGSLTGSFDTGSGVDGLSVAGTVLPGVGRTPTSITLSPLAATSPIGSPVTLTAHVTDASGNPVPGVEISFELLSGPDYDAGYFESASFGGVGTTASGQTDSSGN